MKQFWTVSLLVLLLFSCGRQISSNSQLDLSNDNRVLCVFDYDLTLSSNKCSSTQGRPEFFCRWNQHSTYGWYDQCLAIHARQAVARCVAAGAHIGIASHSPIGSSWNDKVAPIVYQQQFPEWTSSSRYPRVDDGSSWNCSNCAYHMNPAITKAEGIRRIMRHYHMDPYNRAHQARVLFWDDSHTNIGIVGAELPGVHAIHVARNHRTGESGGCGITGYTAQLGWDAL